MHLVRPVRDPQRPDLRPHVRQRRILTHARAAEALHRAVDDRQRHLRDEDFGLGDFLQRAFGVGFVDFDGGVEHDEAGGVDFEPRLGDPFEDDAVLVELLAERFLVRVVDAREHPLEGALGGADGAHRVVDAAGAEPALDDFEAAPFAEDHVGGGDAHVVEVEVAVAVRGVVVAVDGEHAFDRYAFGGGGDEHHGLLFVNGGVGRRAFAHDNVDFASRVTGAAAPPFLRGGLVFVWVG